MSGPDVVIRLSPSGPCSALFMEDNETMRYLWKSLFDGPSRTVDGPHRLTAEDMSDFSVASRAIYDLMRDKEWHSRDEIIAASGLISGMKRMRELRRTYNIEKRMIHDKKRVYEYRLVNS